MSIEDSIKIGLDGVVSVATFPDVFDNFQGQELLAIQTKDLGPSETPVKFKIPYPGNNNTGAADTFTPVEDFLLYTSPSQRDRV